MVTGFPADKFLVAIHKSKSGSPLGGGLLRPLAWWWSASNMAADWLLSLCMLFGMPIRWATYEKEAPQARIDEICGMLKNMGSQAWGAFAAGTDIKLIEPSTRGDSTPQADLLDRAEKQMDLLILGQTLTSDASKLGGSRAQAEVHERVKGEIVQAAANFTAGVINTQWIPSILRLNYGPEGDDQAPVFRPVPKNDKDAKADADRDAVLMAAGVPMPKAWFYKRHDIPLPQPQEETIGGNTADSQKRRFSNPSDASDRSDSSDGSDMTA
jgi:phage gp29-like protein